MSDSIRVVGGGYWECAHGETHHASEVCDCRASERIVGGEAAGSGEARSDEGEGHRPSAEGGRMSAGQRISYGAVVAEVIEQLPLRCYNCSALGPCREDAARITALRELARLIEEASGFVGANPQWTAEQANALLTKIAVGFQPTEREQDV